LLAGRKLLLADDSITIQKVVDLTFADEGVSVVCVNDGREAIERLAEFIPDVVLLDVFMPRVNGYEVCRYIKQHENLKHIPVLLLVGSFEPFDEEEARRVGANDTLTKPFQSIRRLIDKVGQMVGSRPPEEQIPTAELPQPEPEPVEKLSTAELEMTTADTKPLPAELKHVVDAAAAIRDGQQIEQAKVKETMSSKQETRGAEGYEGAGEVLLDLGDYNRRTAVPDDEFVLDIDLDEVPDPSPVQPAFSSPSLRSGYNLSADTQTVVKPLNGSPYASSPSTSSASTMPLQATRSVDPLATTQEWERSELETVAEPSVVAEESKPVSTSELATGQLSPELIDAIARRAVEQLSERVVQEIAWEVVPQLAELLIKRQLEEKNS
jgi:CheY-like chemotaxis protein